MENRSFSHLSPLQESPSHSFIYKAPTKLAAPASLSDNSQTSLYVIIPPLDQPETNTFLGSTLYLAIRTSIISLKYPTSSILFLLAELQQSPAFQEGSVIPGLASANTVT